MNPAVYLDYAATTPVDPRVAETVCFYLEDALNCGNPASTHHAFGRAARDAVEEARSHVAALLNAQSAQIVWTSGATESINLAIKGAARHARLRGRHIVTVASEHKAVLNACHALSREGFETTFVDPLASGIVDLDRLADALRSDTVLISIMHVNNETGVIQDIEEISRIAHNHGALVHIDAAQSAGKLAIDVASAGIDLLSCCAHKIYGPKGIGVLFIRNGTLLGDEALMHGGGQEAGLRSGTLPVHQIMGMGKAFELASKVLADDAAAMDNLNRRLRSGLNQIEGVWYNGDPVHTLKNIVNFGISGIDGEELALEIPDIALSTGSACGSFDQQPSHVLRTLGLSAEEISSSLRISMGRFTTEAEIECAVASLRRAVDAIR